MSSERETARASEGSVVTLDVNLPFNDEGCATLLVDGDFSVNILRHDEEGRLTLAAVVAQELKEDIGYAQILDLLDLALGPLMGESPAVGRDPVSGALVAYVSLSYAHLTEATWEETLGRFVAFAKGIAETL